MAWCGPCDVMENNYRALFFSIPEAASRIEFFTACEDYIPEDIKAKLQFGPLTCKPRFALFLEGKKLAEIDGADFTQLDALVTKCLPTLDE